MKYKNNYFVLGMLLLGMPAANAAPEAEETPQEAQVPLPGGLVGNYLSGQFAKSSGDVDSAIRYLRKAHRDNPENPHIATQLSSMLLINGDVAEAIKLVEDTYDETDRDPVAALLVAVHDIKMDDFTRATSTLDGAFDNGSGQLWMPLVQAWLDVSRHELTKPLKLEDLSTGAGRASNIVNYHLALINNSAGFIEEAAANFSLSVEDPVNPPLRVMEMLLHFYEKNNRPEILTPVVTAYRSANGSNALTGNAPMIEKPKDGVAEVLFTMGSIMQGAGVLQDAVIYLQLAHYLKPDFTLSTIGLADAYSDMKRYEKSNALYAVISEKDRLYDKARLGMVINYDRMGKTGDALALLDKMIARAPKSYDAQVAKGDLLRLHARYGEAVEIYSQALKRAGELRAQHWPILFARGSCYERLGKWTLAERDLLQALALKPNQPDVLNYLGYSWLIRNERVMEARAMIEKAVKERPNDPQIVDSMGWASYLLKDYADAAMHIEKALELMPGDATINDHLGDVYWRLGRKTEARYQWERSLSFNPESPAAIEAIRKKIKDGLPPDGMAEKPKAPVVAAEGAAENAIP